MRSLLVLSARKCILQSNRSGSYYERTKAAKRIGRAKGSAGNTPEGRRGIENQGASAGTSQRAEAEGVAQKRINQIIHKLSCS